MPSQSFSRALAQLLRTEYALDGPAVDDLLAYFLRQEAFSEVPDAVTCLVEAIRTSGGANYHVHTPLNRKANDVLARITSARLMRAGKSMRPVLSVVADLGFALWTHAPVEVDPDHPLEGTHRDEAGRAYFEFTTDAPGEVQRVIEQYNYTGQVELTETPPLRPGSTFNCRTLARVCSRTSHLRALRSP